jgi:hypothetical protein
MTFSLVQREFTAERVNQLWLAVAALRNAVALRDVDATALHSDRCSQFRSRKFVELLRHEGITGSMGRRTSSIGERGRSCGSRS